MRKSFDAELIELGEALTEMANTVCDAIEQVTVSLVKGDEASAHAVVANTAGVDQKERDIESHCLSLLLRQQPVARDLRTISTALKMPILPSWLFCWQNREGSVFLRTSVG